jgi:hypothetical protein
VLAKFSEPDLVIVEKVLPHPRALLLAPSGGLWRAVLVIRTQRLLECILFGSFFLVNFLCQKAARTEVRALLK